MGFFSQIKESFNLIVSQKQYIVIYRSFFGTPQYPLYAFLTILYAIYYVRKSFFDNNSRNKGFLGFIERFVFSFLYAFAPREILAIFVHQKSPFFSHPRLFGVYFSIFIIYEIAPRNIIQKISNFILFSTLFGYLRGILQSRMLITSLKY